MVLIAFIYSAILRSRLSRRVILHESLAFFIARFYISTKVVYNHAPFLFMQSHIRKVHACLAVTCHLPFRQNDRGLLRATAVTLGVERGTNSEIRVSTENWPWRRKFSSRPCRGSNPRPFNHESGALTTELPIPHWNSLTHWVSVRSPWPRVARELQPVAASSESVPRHCPSWNTFWLHTQIPFTGSFSISQRSPQRYHNKRYHDRKKLA